MNVQTHKPATVIQTLCVKTLLGLSTVNVKTATLGMELFVKVVNNINNKSEPLPNICVTCTHTTNHGRSHTHLHT